MRATVADAIEGSAHLVADGACLRISDPANGGGEWATVISEYPEPGLPDHHEVVRLPGGASARQVAAALRRRGYSHIVARWDD